MNKITGREKELKEIKEVVESSRCELVCVYGRRRVGKTYLIKEYFNNTFDFYYTGICNKSNKRQLSLFNSELINFANKEIDNPIDWFKAFQNLKNYLLSLNKDKVIVFIDELPWMDSPNSFFIDAFTNFWNTWDNHNDKRVLLKLICCGSSATWMIDKIIGDKGGLYGRITRKIYLKPFNLYETKEYFNNILNANFSNQEVLDYYMILGGIPYYLSKVKKDYTYNKNIDELFFEEGADLAEEYNFLFRSLFKKSNNYEVVIEALSTKLIGLTREEIRDITKLEGGMLTKILENLINCDFIREYKAFGKIKKQSLFQLTDFYSLFYLRFVKNKSYDKHHWTNILDSGEVNAWKGYAFEQVCFHHIEQIKNYIGISGISSTISSWKANGFIDETGIEWKGGQIDMIIDRDDKIINLCEMKYTKNEYIITQDYARLIANRNELFKRITKTKKTIKCTFITTCGIKGNTNNIVDNELTMECFFR